MLTVQLVPDRRPPSASDGQPAEPDVLAVPVAVTGDDAVDLLPALPDAGVATFLAGDGARPRLRALLDEARSAGAAGMVTTLPRPLRRPRRILLVGVGDADEAGWRAAGAALARAGARDEALTVVLPAGHDDLAVRGLAEGALLGSYRFRLGADDSPPRLERLEIVVDDPARYADALAAAQTVADATAFARDLTNTPSDTKSPAWLAAQVVERAAGVPGLSVTVRDEAELASGGFGGILAVGGGSARPPRLLELSWRPARATTHVVLVGKGITFDTGGISIKPRDAMKLMRKDMGGAAAVLAATLAAARLDLPVRVTALAPLAENMPGADAFRPGDVVRHFGGRTSEVLNTDAEGRVVLADALAYAERDLAPDMLVDLATLTGANAIALGKRTAALYTENAGLADALAAAATGAGERVWRMPLVDDYQSMIASDVADVANAATAPGGAGSVTAALYLREFVGACRDRWVHLDMSAPSWSDGPDAELARGATGWGVRTLLRWLATLPA